MNYTNFIRTELAAAIARGVRQCVVIAAGQPLSEAFTSALNAPLRIFVVDELVSTDLPATFVPTHFASETLAGALHNSEFDRLKTSLFIWLGGTAYRAVESVMGSLAFIASLPKGSGVVFDYVAERTSLESHTQTALDALSSRISLSSGSFKHLIHPQAVAAMLSGMGFQQVVDLAKQEFAGSGHLVSAVV